MISSGHYFDYWTSTSTWKSYLWTAAGWIHSCSLSRSLIAAHTVPNHKSKFAVFSIEGSHCITHPEAPKHSTLAQEKSQTNTDKTVFQMPRPTMARCWPKELCRKGGTTSGARSPSTVGRTLCRSHCLLSARAPGGGEGRVWEIWPACDEWWGEVVRETLWCINCR